MSVESITAALPRRGLTPTQKLVLIGIANHDGDGGAWPSVATLSNYAECSTRQVQRALADLIELGLVERLINEGGTKAMKDHTRPNLYVLHLEEGVTWVSPPDLDVTPPPDPGVTGGVTWVSPEPSLNRPGEPSSSDKVATQLERAGWHISPNGDAITRAQEDVEAFELFWATYGKVGPRKKAHECWLRARKISSAAEIQAGLEAWCAYWRSPNAANVKWPQGWLNEERWKDDPPVVLQRVQNTSRSAIDQWLADKAQEGQR